MVHELRRFALGEAFDEQAMPECDSEALDFRAASESFASVRKLKRADLETLRLMMKHQRHKVPTVGGMLLFGKERERYFPDAWVQAGRFRGTDKTSITDTLEIRVFPVRAVEEALLLFRSMPCTAWSCPEQSEGTSSYGAKPRGKSNLDSFKPSE